MICMRWRVFALKDALLNCILHKEQTVTPQNNRQIKRIPSFDHKPWRRFVTRACLCPI